MMMECEACGSVRASVRLLARYVRVIHTLWRRVESEREWSKGGQREESIIGGLCVFHSIYFNLLLLHQYKSLCHKDPPLWVG